jgi:tRNA(fMet)-specific endonuclease VapC
MNGKKHLLDTNIIIDIFSGNSDLKAKIQSFKNPVISSVTIGELYYGAYNSNKPLKHINQIEDFLSICQVVDAVKETAKHYGEIKTQLRKNGTPIPENDIWLSATAIENDLILISRDKHLKMVENLKLLFIE